MSWLWDDDWLLSMEEWRKKKIKSYVASTLLIILCMFLNYMNHVFCDSAARDFINSERVNLEIMIKHFCGLHFTSESGCRRCVQLRGFPHLTTDVVHQATLHASLPAQITTSQYLSSISSGECFAPYRLYVHMFWDQTRVWRRACSADEGGEWPVM